LIRGRGIGYIREASPLFDSPSVSLSLKGEGEGLVLKGWNPFNLPPLAKEKGRVLGRGSAPLLPLLPLPLVREGGQGDRLLSNLWLRLLTARFWL